MSLSIVNGHFLLEAQSCINIRNEDIHAYAVVESAENQSTPLPPVPARFEQKCCHTLLQRNLPAPSMLFSIPKYKLWLTQGLIRYRKLPFQYWHGGNQEFFYILVELARRIQRPNTDLPALYLIRRRQICSCQLFGGPSNIVIARFAFQLNCNKLLTIREIRPGCILSTSRYDGCKFLQICDTTFIKNVKFILLPYDVKQ